MQIAEWLEGVEYMPGWRFRLGEHDEGPAIAIEFSVPDARRPGRRQAQRVWSLVPPCESRQQFLTWLRWRLQRIAIHEVNEFFTVDGEIWRDPHLPFEAQLKE